MRSHKAVQNPPPQASDWTIETKCLLFFLFAVSFERNNRGRFKAMTTLPLKMTTIRMTGKNRFLLHLCWILLACSALPALLRAALHTEKVDTETDYYAVTYDDRRIGTAEMKEILYLSPYYPADVPSPYFAASEVFHEGRNVVRNKWFVSIPLEQCNPGYAACGQEQPDPAFFANAQENLTKTQSTLQHLPSEKLPQLLEPLRRYLIRHLGETLMIEQARLSFLKTGKTLELTGVECQLCNCADDASARQSVEPIPPQANKTLEWSRLLWFNRVLACIRKNDTGYPMQAWESFIKSFDIHEVYKAKGPE